MDAEVYMSSRVKRRVLMTDVRSQTLEEKDKHKDGKNGLRMSFHIDIFHIDC